MPENREKKIGDYTYTITKLGALTGRTALVRLTHLFGPALGGFRKGGGFVGALEKLASNLTEEDMVFFCETFAPITLVKQPNGKSPKLSDIFDEHFDCRYLEMVQWLAFALEVNFSSFFRGIGEKLAALGGKEEASK